MKSKYIVKECKRCGKKEKLHICNGKYCKKCLPKINLIHQYKWLKNNPWGKTRMRIANRCRKKGIYGRKGIKNLLSCADLKTLWFRDRADLMKRPSIDRKDTKGNYTFKNCRYMELGDNIRRQFTKDRKLTDKQREAFRQNIMKYNIARKAGKV